MSSIPYEQPGNYFTRTFKALRDILFAPVMVAQEQTGRLHYDVHRVLNEAKSQPFYGVLTDVACAKFRDGHGMKTGADLVGDLENTITYEVRRGAADAAARNAHDRIWGSSPPRQSRDATQLLHALDAYEFVTGEQYDVVRKIGQESGRGKTAGAELAFLPA